MVARFLEAVHLAFTEWLRKLYFTFLAINPMVSLIFEDAFVTKEPDEMGKVQDLKEERPDLEGFNLLKSATSKTDPLMLKDLLLKRSDVAKGFNSCEIEICQRDPTLFNEMMWSYKWQELFSLLKMFQMLMVMQEEPDLKRKQRDLRLKLKMDRRLKLWQWEGWRLEREQRSLERKRQSLEREMLSLKRKRQRLQMFPIMKVLKEWRRLDRKSQNLEWKERRIKRERRNIEVARLDLEETLRRQRIQQLMIQILEQVEKIIMWAVKKWRYEKRKDLLSKKCALSMRNCSYSETLLSKKKTYSKLNGSYSDTLLQKNDNAFSGPECRFSIQIRNFSGDNRLQLALAYKKRSKDISAAERRNWRRAAFTKMEESIVQDQNYLFSDLEGFCDSLPLEIWINDTDSSVQNAVAAENVLDKHPLPAENYGIGTTPFTDQVCFAVQQDVLEQTLFSVHNFLDTMEEPDQVLEELAINLATSPIESIMNSSNIDPKTDYDLKTQHDLKNSVIKPSNPIQQSSAALPKLFPFPPSLPVDTHSTNGSSLSKNQLSPATDELLESNYVNYRNHQTSCLSDSPIAVVPGEFPELSSFPSESAVSNIKFNSRKRQREEDSYSTESVALASKRRTEQPCSSTTEGKAPENVVEKRGENVTCCVRGPSKMDRLLRQEDALKIERGELKCKLEALLREREFLKNYIVSKLKGQCPFCKGLSQFEI